MKKYVLFDFDGTLVDSQILYDIAASESLAKINPKYTIEYCINYFNGRGWYDVFAEIHKLEPEKNIPSALQEALINAEKLTKTHIKAMPNCSETLERLIEEGCKIAICSNSSIRAILEHLEICNLSKFFKEEDIFSKESVTNAKPAPEIYLKAVSHFNAKKEECIVVEDSIAGLRSACFAGVDSILFKGGSHHIKNEDNTKNILESLKNLENNTLKGEIKNLLEIFDFLK